MSIQSQFEELYEKKLKSFLEVHKTEATNEVNKEQIKLLLYKDLLKKVLDEMFKNDSRIMIEANSYMRRYLVIRLYYINGLREKSYTEVFKIQFEIMHLNELKPAGIGFKPTGKSHVETSKTMVKYKTYNTQQEYTGVVVSASNNGQKVMELDLDKIPKFVEESINRVNRVIKKYNIRNKRYKIMHICREKEILN